MTVGVSEGRGLAAGVGARVEAVARWTEQHPRWVLGVLLLLYCIVSVQAARAHPLWSDEWYTWHIATQPTMLGMLQLAREVDLHPPLHYLLERWALRLPLPLEIGARLPNLVAGAVLLAALYRLSARRFGGAVAVASAAVLLLGQPLKLAWENRPYMVLFCLVVLLVAAWSRATRPEGRRGLWLVAVLGLSLLMTLDHLLGVLCLVPFAAAEGWRIRERRRVDWAMAAALFLPATVGLGLWYQVHHLRQNGFAAVHLASVGTVVETYGGLLEEFAFAGTWCVLAASLLPRERTRPLGQEGPWRGAELVLLYGLALMPVLVGLAGAVARVQVWQRYGFVAEGALALLAAQGLAHRLPAPRAVGVLLLLAVAGMMAGLLGDEGTSAQTKVEQLRRPGEVLVRLEALPAGLPLVVASPIVYTEAAHREPRELARRTFYVTDREAAERFSGYTLFENEAKMVRLLGLPTEVAPMREFLRTYRQFYLLADVGRTEEWLGRALMAEGASLHYLGRADAGYEDGDVFLVTSP